MKNLLRYKYQLLSLIFAILIPVAFLIGYHLGIRYAPPTQQLPTPTPEEQPPEAPPSPPEEEQQPPPPSNQTTPSPFNYSIVISLSDWQLAGGRAARITDLRTNETRAPNEYEICLINSIVRNLTGLTPLNLSLSFTASFNSLDLAQEYANFTCVEASPYLLYLNATLYLNTTTIWLATLLAKLNPSEVAVPTYTLPYFLHLAHHLNTLVNNLTQIHAFFTLEFGNATDYNSTKALIAATILNWTLYNEAIDLTRLPSHIQPLAFRSLGVIAQNTTLSELRGAHRELKPYLTNQTNIEDLLWIAKAYPDKVLTVNGSFEDLSKVVSILASDNFTKAWLLVNAYAFGSGKDSIENRTLLGLAWGVPIPIIVHTKAIGKKVADIGCFLTDNVKQALKLEFGNIAINDEHSLVSFKAFTQQGLHSSDIVEARAKIPYNIPIYAIIPYRIQQLLNEVPEANLTQAAEFDVRFRWLARKTNVTGIGEIPAYNTTSLKFWKLWFAGRPYSQLITNKTWSPEVFINYTHPVCRFFSFIRELNNTFPSSLDDLLVKYANMSILAMDSSCEAGLHRPAAVNDGTTPELAMAALSNITGAYLAKLVEWSEKGETPIDLGLLPGFNQSAKEIYWRGLGRTLSRFPSYNFTDLQNFTWDTTGEGPQPWAVYANWQAFLDLHNNITIQLLNNQTLINELIDYVNSTLRSGARHVIFSTTISVNESDVQLMPFFETCLNSPITKAWVLAQAYYAKYINRHAIGLCLDRADHRSFLSGSIGVPTLCIHYQPDHASIGIVMPSNITKQLISIYGDQAINATYCVTSPIGIQPAYMVSKGYPRWGINAVDGSGLWNTLIIWIYKPE